MKLKHIVTLALGASALSASGAVGIFESYGILKIGTTTQYYDLQATTGNPDFQNADLGDFDTVTGPTLTLVGAEIKTWKNSGGDVTGGRFDYKVYTVGGSPGGFSEFSLGFVEDIGVNGDQKWANTGANINLLQGLTNGDYVLEVFSYAITNEGDRFSNNSGANYKASFTVVPEPTSAALSLFGGLLLLRRRRG